jgi:hypothetical protein
LAGSSPTFTATRGASSRICTPTLSRSSFTNTIRRLAGALLPHARLDLLQGVGLRVLPKRALFFS